MLVVLWTRSECQPGQPKGGDPRAAYALLDDGIVVLKRVGYDVEAVGKDLIESAPQAVALALAGVMVIHSPVGAGIDFA